MIYEKIIMNHGNLSNNFYMYDCNQEMLPIMHYINVKLIDKIWKEFTIMGCSNCRSKCIIIIFIVIGKLNLEVIILSCNCELKFALCICYY